MKATDGKTGKCPECGGRVSDDRKKRGFVRHLYRKPERREVPVRIEATRLRRRR